MEAYEKRSLLVSKPFDAEDTAYGPLSESYKRVDNVNDFALVSGDVGPVNQDILLEISNTSSEEDSLISFTLDSVDGPSDSGLSSLAAGDSNTNLADKPSDTEDPADVPERSTPSISEEDFDIETSWRELIRASTGGPVISEMSGSSTESSSDLPSFLQPGTIFEEAWENFLYQMFLFRDWGYFLPFEIICLAFTITCCFLGAYNWDMCPANVYIPRYVFFNGIVASFAVFVQIVDSIGKLAVRRQYDNYKKYFYAFLIGLVAVITTLIEITEFYTMTYSFHRSEENYCNEAFYRSVNYKNIALVVIMTLATMIYYPTFNFYNQAAYIR